MLNLFCEDIHIEYVRVIVIDRGHPAEYVIRILVAAPPEYVNTYSKSSCVRPKLAACC